MESRTVPVRKDGRIIIHFDYDCFYAAVFEAKNPNLKSLPFAVQQKQIIVTCNYEARRRGLHKLQLIREAKQICPDVIIELGEDISRFRDASKELYTFIEAYTWNGKVERLGFDEVWLDATDMVDYNMEILNRNDLANSFFQMSRDDPIDGFSFDATTVAGHTYPDQYESSPDDENNDLTMRLRLGSHLASHMRHELEYRKGYTSTVGVATSKLISKLVGNLHKPNDQTVLMPPYGSEESYEKNNITKFMDSYDIGKVPGIGFKLGQKIREHVLQRPAAIDESLVYGATKECVTVADVRQSQNVSPEKLERLLTGPGSPHGIGLKVWQLVHGVDDSEVSQMRRVPRQISIEDSYIRLDTMPEVLKELNSLANSLLTRMRVDLLGEEDGSGADRDHDDTSTHAEGFVSDKRWLAHPKTLRLTTRPRQQLLPDGTRPRSFKRISHSASLPTFVFKLGESVESLAEKLVRETLVNMFRRLYPEKAGWNLSLVNLAVTNMAETAGDTKTANGRDIGNMFKRQDDVLRDFRVTELADDLDDRVDLSEVVRKHDETSDEDQWEDDLDGAQQRCNACGLDLPPFAMIAHLRFHALEMQ